MLVKTSGSGKFCGICMIQDSQRQNECTSYIPFLPFLKSLFPLTVLAQLKAK